MELTPELLTDEVEFRTAFRGYEREQVDAFLERVAAAVAQLQKRLADAEKSGSSEALASKDPDPAVTTDDMAAVATVEAAHRTLLMAQRTGDEAVREARNEAEKILEDAKNEVTRLEAEATASAEEAQVAAAGLTERSQAEAIRVTEEAAAQAIRIIDEAATAAEELRAQSEAEVHTEATQARQLLNTEIEGLTRYRANIRNDLALLDRHLVGQRQVIRDALAEVATVLEDPNRFHLGIPEGLSADVGTDELPQAAAFDTTGSTADDGLENATDATDATTSPDGDDEAEPVGASSAEGGNSGPDLDLSDQPDQPDHAVPDPVGDEAGDRERVDGDVIANDLLGAEAPERHEGSEAVATAEPTAEAVRWDFDDDLSGDGGEHPDFWKSSAEPGTPGDVPPQVAVDEEDAFLDELRQAITDGDGVAWTGGESGSSAASSGDEDGSGRNRRGFGRRR